VLFFSNDHLVGVIKWRCRWRGTSWCWGVSCLGGWAML